MYFAQLLLGPGAVDDSAADDAVGIPPTRGVFVAFKSIPRPCGETLSLRRRDAAAVRENAPIAGNLAYFHQRLGAY